MPEKFNHATKGELTLPTNRRKFLKQLALLTGGVLLIPEALNASQTRKKKRLVILHTNDFHSRVEPFADNHPKYPGQGGIKALKSLIDEERKKEKNVLLLDCGDIIQGTPYFNLFGGNVEIEWMNKIGFNASTLGNHDFDGGMENLKKLINKAKFPFINCNYDFEKSILKEAIIPYKILKIQNLKVGITAVGINPKGLVPDHLCTGIQYLDPVESVNKIARLLKKEKHCDYVICLSHLGYEYKNDLVSDSVLATKTRNIDLILGGHTHTFLDAPVTLNNADGKPVIVNQAGWAGLRLGRIVAEW